LAYAPATMVSKSGDVTRRRDAGRARGAPIVDAVLAATLTVLGRDGLEALSVDAVASEASVNKTSVYRRWPTRDLLVVAALERVLEQATAELPNTGSLQSDLMTLMLPVCGLLDSPLGLALMHASTLQANASPLQQIAKKQLRRGAPAARQLFARAIARGDAAPDIHPRVVLGMLVGAVMHRVLLERAPANEAWLRELLLQASHGTSPRKPG
jgi:AcrR family transcriptional regulator